METSLTVSPTYSLEPSTFEYLEQKIPGDNTWHTYTFEFTRPYYAGTNNVYAVDFYFDRDTSVVKSGVIEMDNFKIAWYVIKVTDIKVIVEDGTNIRLNWKASDTTQIQGFRIYRDIKPTFKTDESKLITEVQSTNYLDENLNSYQHYFYKIIPVGTSGEVFLLIF